MNTSYTPCMLNIILHSIPRLSFKLVFSQYPKFSIDNAEYLEGLLTIALVPAALLLLTMLSFLIFYCWIKFKQSEEKESKNKFYCSSCLILFFMVIALCSIGLATYGSLVVGGGINQALKAMSKTNRSLSSISFNIKGINLLMDTMKFQITKLYQIIPENEYMKIMLKLVYQVQRLMFDFPTNTDKVINSLEQFISYVKTADNYRFLITFFSIGLISFVSFLVLVGMCFRSNFCLGSSAFIGQLCLIGSYVYMGILFAIVVGMADLCTDPNYYLAAYAQNNLPISNDTIYFYQHCMKNQTLDMPYSNVIIKSVGLLNGILGTIRFIEKENLPYKAERNLYDLGVNTDNLKLKLELMKRDLECDNFKTPLDEFVPSICVAAFQGVGITILSMFGVCLGLTIILCIVPKTWKKISANKTKVENEYEEPPYTSQPTYRSWIVERNPLNRQSNDMVRTTVTQPPIMSMTKKLPPRSYDYHYQHQPNPPPYAQYH